MFEIAHDFPQECGGFFNFYRWQGSCDTVRCIRKQHVFFQKKNVAKYGVSHRNCKSCFFQLVVLVAKLCQSLQCNDLKCIFHK